MNPLLSHPWQHGGALQLPTPQAPAMPVEVSVPAHIVRSVADRGDNAHAAVNALLGIPAPATLGDHFDALARELVESGLNENSDLILELDAFRKKIEGRLAERRGVRKAACEKEHAEVYAKCREALDSVRALTVQFNQAKGFFNGAISKLNEAQTRKRTIEASQPSAQNYPTRAEWDAWSVQVEQANSQVRLAQADHDVALKEHNRVAGELAIVERELARLREREQILRSQLDALGQERTTR